MKDKETMIIYHLCGQTRQSFTLLTGIGQGVEVSAQHQWNGISLTRDGGQLEAACGLVHYVLHL